jgi:uncharacterized protein YjiS (DUF1127 family)
MANVSVNAPLTATLTERTSGFAQRLRKSWQEYRVYRQTLDELSALSDRELMDLGMSRSEIRRVSLEAAKRI